MRRDLIRFIGLLILILAFGLWIYPTPYIYTHMGDANLPVKINRITGETKVFNLNGEWVDLSKDSQ